MSNHETGGRHRSSSVVIEAERRSPRPDSAGSRHDGRAPGRGRDARDGKRTDGRFDDGRFDDGPSAGEPSEKESGNGGVSAGSGPPETSSAVRFDKMNGSSARKGGQNETPPGNDESPGAENRAPGAENRGPGGLTKRQRRRRRKAAGGAASGTFQSGGPASGEATPSSSSGAAQADKPRGEAARPGALDDGHGKPARKRRRRRGRKRFKPEGEAGGLGARKQAATGKPSGEAGRGRPQAAPAREGRPDAYAALDLGTNNCRLLIAVPNGNARFRVIDAFSRIVRLGEGLSRTGSLSQGAMERALAALSICADKLAARQVKNCRLIATEACRQAANGEEFIDRVAAVTGLNLEIVSRETEARLAVSGCGSLVDRRAKGAVLFDIGGGSSEIALLDLRERGSRSLANRIVAWTSLPVGVVTLAERHGGRDVTPEIFQAMVQDTLDLIAGFSGRQRLNDLLGTERFHLLGTSGTVTTLAGVHLGLERYDRRQVDGLWLMDEETEHLIETLAGWSFVERVANPCIGSDRADLVLAGCAILQAIRQTWPSRSLRVADRGIREGLLTEMMLADGVWRPNEKRGRADR